MRLRLISSRKDPVHTYFDGFRRSDHEAILACLTDDVVWDIPGYAQLHGKAEFDAEIENPDFEGSPALDLDRLVEEDFTIVALGAGEGRRVGGDTFRFAFCTVFTFTDDLIGRVESYVVPLPS
jgi:ketosteroid isomerase-like protein